MSADDDERVDQLLADVLATPGRADDPYEAARAEAVDRFMDSIAVSSEPYAGERRIVAPAPTKRSSKRRILGTVSALGLLLLVAIFVVELRPWTQSSRSATEVSQRFDFGAATQVMAEYAEPQLLEATRTDRSRAGRPMASGFTFDPDAVFVASGTFPLGVVLELTSVDGKASVTAPVRDTAASDLVVSSAALTELGFPPSAGRIQLWVRAVDYEAKRRLGLDQLRDNSSHPSP